MDVLRLSKRVLHRFKKMPHDYGCRAGDVERVLGATLRDFQTAVGHVHHLLLHAFHFVAQHEGVALAGLWLKTLEAHTAMHLLDGADGITLLPQLLYGLKS